MSRFVWTEKGNTVHISQRYMQPMVTRCGRPAIGDVDAGDVLYYQLCQKCRKSIENERTRDEMAQPWGGQASTEAEGGTSNG